MTKPKSFKLHVSPSCHEAEAMVLGGILLDGGNIAKIAEILHSTMFDKKVHRLIYEAAFSLYQRDLPIDLLTLGEELGRRKTLREVGGKAYVSKLALNVSAVTNLAHYAAIIRERYELCQVRYVALRLVDMVSEGAKSSREVIDYAQQAVYDLGAAAAHDEIRSAAEIVGEQVEVIEAIANGKRKVRGVPTGFSAMDDIIQGFHPGDLVLIGARPSVGKSSLALDLARNIAKTGTGVLLFSIEMGKDLVGNRLLAAQGQVSLHKISGGYAGKTAREAIHKAKDVIAALPLFIDASPRLTPLQMRSRVKLMKLKHDIGLVIVDYLQLMEHHKKAENRQQEVTAISRSLKAMAREFNITVLALSQLSRGMKGVVRKPRLSDLRESGALEQDADVVILMHNPNKDDSRDPNISIECKIAKQRNGPVATFRLQFNKASTSFCNATDMRWDSGIAPNRVNENEEDAASTPVGMEASA